MESRTSPAHATTAPAQRFEERPKFSVVVPCYNEEAGIHIFHHRLATVMAGLEEPWEVIYVNDGSEDRTLCALSAIGNTDPHVVVINLSRNFGKEIALTAGLDHAAGEAVVVIDADLQDPPEVIRDLVAGWREGFDIVYAQRRVRQGETVVKKLTASLFYRLMHRIGGMKLPRDTGDFRLMSRRSLDAVLRLRERHRFMKGLFAWVGFPSKAVLYDRAPRLAGETSWNYWRLWNFALEGITGFSVAPLKMATYIGLGVAAFAAIFGLQLIVRTVVFGNPVAGYPSLMVVVLFLGGVQMIMLGILGEYLARIFNEVKQRPLYLVERVCSSNGRAVPAAVSQPSEQCGSDLRHPIEYVVTHDQPDRW